MDDEQARTTVERAKAAIEKACFALVTPQQLRLTQGQWLMLGSICAEDNASAWQVWYQPESDGGRLWPLIVTNDGGIPRRFEP